MEKTMAVNTCDKFLISKNNTIIQVSKRLLEISGYTEDEFIGKSLMEVASLLKINCQINLHHIEGPHMVYIFNKEALPIDVTITCKSSSEEDIKTYYIEENQQKFLSNILSSFDNLTISNKQAWAIYSYPDCICLKTNEKYRNNLTSINMTGNNPLGKSYSYLRYISQMMEEDFYDEEGVEFIGRNGIATYWDMSVKLISGDENKRYLLLSLYDVSNKLDISHEVGEGRKMEETLEMQNQIFSIVSHELKTPLSIIFSASQLVELYLKKEPNMINKEYIGKNIDIIKQNCYRFTKLINNIIDSSRIESGFYELNYSNSNIIEIVEDIVDSTRVYLEEKGLEIIFHTEVEEKVIATDVNKLERIILNLISNAVKFSYKDGKINIDIFDRGEFIEILVRDYGVGIKDVHMNTIFNKYHRVDNSLSRNAEGSGIGLTLARTMVELLDGEISVESSLDKGSLFTVRLPVRLLDESEVMGARNSLVSRVEQVNIELSDIYDK